MKMRGLILILSVILMGSSLGVSQVAINTDGSTSDSSAILDVKSTDQGFLLPRMTISQRDGINSPAMGLFIFNTEDQNLQVFDGSYWRPITMGSCSPPQPGSITGNTTPYQNAIGESYSISAVYGATSYNWTIPSGATIASGQGTISISVNFGITNGDVSVRSESGCGVSTYVHLAIALEIPLTCSDGVQNENETGIDCGGPNCDPCESGEDCIDNSDCQSGVCADGICQPSTCSDGVQNGNETGIDCGGPDCDPCTSGEDCLVNSDCQSGVCAGGICQTPTCFDSVQNGNETGVDCGGDCDPCTSGEDCIDNSDCQSGVCVDGVCQPPTCSDGVQNGNETGVDCGGDCDPC
jgi:hypothetical protein